jgi:5-formyltetrahydrofolate cyclo-ligase
MDKPALRKHYKAMRMALSDQETSALSFQIKDKLVDLINDDNLLIHSFLPIKKLKEVDTFPWISYCFENLPQVQIATSISHFKDHSLSHVSLYAETTFHESDFGILEPNQGHPINPKDIDVVLVPLLCCDSLGNRVGYGQGFYDRFLKQCNKETLTIGLSFFEPLTETIPTNNHDIPLHMLVTPQKVYTFKR